MAILLSIVSPQRLRSAARDLSIVSRLITRSATMQIVNLWRNHLRPAKRFTVSLLFPRSWTVPS